MMDIVDTVNIEGTRWFGGEILGNSGNTKLTRISRHDRRLSLTELRVLGDPFYLQWGE